MNKFGQVVCVLYIVGRCKVSCGCLCVACTCLVSLCVDNARKCQLCVDVGGRMKG